MIDQRKATDALLALIQEATGMPCGDVQIPAAGTGPAPPPYYLLHTIANTLSGAPLADLNEDASIVYQVTCVSGPDPAKPNSRGAREQAEWMAGKVRSAVLGRDPDSLEWLHDLAVPGAKVMGRGPEAEAGVTNDPGDAIISYVLRFRIDLTAA